MCYLLASKLGIPEEQTLWKLPLAKAIAYQHCICTENGVDTFRDALPDNLNLSAIQSEILNRSRLEYDEEE